MTIIYDNVRTPCQTALQGAGMLAELLVPVAQALSFWLAHQSCRNVLLDALAVVLFCIVDCMPACLLAWKVGGTRWKGGGGRGLRPWLGLMLSHVCGHGSISRPVMYYWSKSLERQPLAVFPLGFLRKMMQQLTSHKPCKHITSVQAII